MVGSESWRHIVNQSSANAVEACHLYFPALGALCLFEFLLAPCDNLVCVAVVFTMALFLFFIFTRNAISIKAHFNNFLEIPDAVIR